MQLRKILLFVLVMVFLGTASTSAYEANLRPFPDVTSTDWAKDAIYSLAVTGSIKGYPDQTFRPDGQLTREAFIHLLVQAVRLPGEGSSVQLKDVEATRWSNESIKIAYQQGMIQFLIHEDRLQPQQPITREEVATIVGNYLLSRQSEETKKVWSETGWLQSKEKHPFLDQEAINGAFAPSLYYSVDQGIMLGDAKGTFRPHDLLKRKEAAALIYRMIGIGFDKDPLVLLGFYAIRSYPQIDQISALDRLAVAWSEMSYEQQGNATLNLSTGFYNLPDGWEEVIQRADANGVKKDLMVFYNKPDIEKFVQDEAAQQAFVQSLIETLDHSSYGYTGVCIDFENLKTEASQAEYIRFLEKVRAAIGEKSLTVAVPPTNYFKGYDLQKIGEVADQVLLMAHDFTHGASGLPSAPLPLVHEAISTALKAIPKEKLILGISKQANQWVTTASGTISSPYSPEISMVEKRLNEDGISQAISYPFFLRKIQFSDPRGQHVIWYEDTESIQKKLWLAKYHGLLGVSLWYMGNFTDEDWKMLKSERALTP